MQEDFNPFGVDTEVGDLTQEIHINYTCDSYQNRMNVENVASIYGRWKLFNSQEKNPAKGSF